MRTKTSAQDKIRPGSEYYFRVANSFRIGKYVCALLFALFMIMMLFVYGDKITYNNFRYMLRDIDAASLLRTDVTFATVNYRTTDPVFESLNGNLVVADQNTVTLYNPAGISVYSIPFDGQNPQLEADGKYLLVHDLGGKAFFLGNTITRLVSGVASGSVFAADVSESGAFALAVASTTTQYEVEVYNSSFSHSATYGVNDCVVDISVSDDGGKIAILAFAGSGDVPDSVLRIGETGKEEYLAVETYPGEFPVSVDFKDDTILILTDRALYLYRENGELLLSRSFDGSKLSAYSIGDSHLAVCLTQNEESVLRLFDWNGNELYESSIISGIKDMAFCRGSLLVLFPGQIFSLSLDSYEMEARTVGDALCILGIEDYGLVCGKNRADAVFVEK